MKNKWTTFRSICLCISTMAFSCHLFSGCAGRPVLNAGEWSIAYDEQSKSLDITKGGILLYDDVYASYKWGDSLVTTRSYGKCRFSVEGIDDNIGTGYRYMVVYQEKGLPVLEQSFYVYPDKDYILTDFTLEGVPEVASNYMAPVNVNQMQELLAEGDNNRALFIPFDNDCWIRYQSHPLTFDELTSYEVTAIFNDDDRCAIVAGSVEHDNWKTGITIGKGSRYNVGSLVCYGGAADKTTRDSKPHGALKGKKIKSPKILLGYFTDWRDGMEEREFNYQVQIYNIFW